MTCRDRITLYDALIVLGIVIVGIIVYFLSQI
jgi:hypothetical protein